MGAGLAKVWLAGILAISVVVFLFWDGPLWSAARGASHVGRILVSYLIVPALVAGALLYTRRWRWRRFASSLALLWAAKLVITALLYSWLAPGATNYYEPSRSWQNEREEVRADTRYRAAEEPGDLFDVSGVVRRDGAPVADVVVAVEAPPPGLPAPAARDLEWTIGAASPERAVRLAYKGDRPSFVNAGTQLHTIRFTGAAGDRRNVAVPPAGTVRAAKLSTPGVFELRCDRHPDERSTLVVVDHPYATVTDARGRFTLTGVPVAAEELRAFSGIEAPAPVSIALPPDGDIEITLDPDPAPAPRRGDA